MWFWILLVLAVIAYFIIKSMTGKSSATDSSATDASASLENSANDAANNLKDSAVAAAESASNAANATAEVASGAAASEGASVAESAAAGVGAAAAAGAAVAGAAANAAHGAASNVAANAAAATEQAAQTVSDLPDLSVNSGNTASDIQEMIKILNLAAPDAGRLGVSKETFAALRAGTDVSADDISGVADKLKRMLA